MNRDGPLFFFLPGVDAPHVYVRAWALGCFHSLISTRTFRRALTASVDSCAEIKSDLFSGVTKSGRVWRKVPESGARSVLCTLWRVVSGDTQTQRCGNCGGVPNPEHAWVHQPPDHVGRPATQPPGQARPSCGRRPVQQKQRGQAVLFGQSGQYRRR